MVGRQRMKKYYGHNESRHYATLLKIPHSWPLPIICISSVVLKCFFDETAFRSFLTHVWDSNHRPHYIRTESADESTELWHSFQNFNVFNFVDLCWLGWDSNCKCLISEAAAWPSFRATWSIISVWPKLQIKQYSSNVICKNWTECINIHIACRVDCPQQCHLIISTKHTHLPPL